MVGISKRTSPTTTTDHEEDSIPYSNGLSDAETERLALLAEELMEAAQVAMKILRHGYVATDNTSGVVYNNRSDLEIELGHVSNAIKLMARNEDISLDRVEQAYQVKRRLIGKHLHHQDKTKL